MHVRKKEEEKTSNWAKEKINILDLQPTFTSGNATEQQTKTEEQETTIIQCECAIL
jgi:lipoate-protein ligase B